MIPEQQLLNTSRTAQHGNHRTLVLPCAPSTHRLIALPPRPGDRRALNPSIGFFPVAMTHGFFQAAGRFLGEFFPVAVGNSRVTSCSIACLPSCSWTPSLLDRALRWTTATAGYCRPKRKESHYAVGRCCPRRRCLCERRCSRERGRPSAVFDRQAKI